MDHARCTIFKTVLVQSTKLVSLFDWVGLVWVTISWQTGG